MCVHALCAHGYLTCVRHGGGRQRAFSKLSRRALAPVVAAANVIATAPGAVVDFVAVVTEPWNQIIGQLDAGGN